MSFNFDPQKLYKVEEEVKQIHREKKEESLKTYDDSYLYALILQIVSWKREDVKANSISLTLEEVKRVVSYIPANKYDVDLNNLFLVYEFRRTEKIANILFEEWQNSYSNSQCCGFMGKLFLSDDEMKKSINHLKLSSDEISTIFAASSIPIEIGKIIVRRKYNRTNIIDNIVEFGLNGKKRLALDIADLFYTYCERQDYLNVGSNRIINAISRYDTDILRLFLINLLKKMSLNDLEDYIDLLKYLLREIGEKGSAGYKKFFAGVDEETENKYNRWIGRKVLFEEFGRGDDRTIFWKQFVFTGSPRPFHFTKSKVLCFKTDTICFVEFIGKEMGPIYWFEREYFEKKMVRYFSSYSSNELKTEILKPIAMEVLKEHGDPWYEDNWKQNWIEDKVIDNTPRMLGRQNHNTYYGDKTWTWDMTRILMKKYGVEKE